MLTILAMAFSVTLQDTSLASRTHTLMPVPRTVQWSDGRLPLDSSFTIGIAGFWDERLDRALVRTLARLRSRTGLVLAQKPANSGTLMVRAGAAGQAVQGVSEDESYTLDVTPAGATLSAPTVVGVIRGVETLLQLVQADARGFYVETAHIEDAPRFRWRGLNVDASRHFMPPEMIRRTLDGMAAVKLNVLHWHLSDDQGFRVESRRYPKLQGMGSDGLYYTPQDVRDIVAYARDRGIRVVPEFDMPGHTQAWLAGYPELAAGPGPFEIERRFGVFDPVFDPTNEQLYRFLDRFIGEIAPLFPDAYWHIGGDEVNGVQWNANARIAEFKRAHGLADNDALQAYFNRRLRTILDKYHKQMIGWDEILHPDLPQGTVIQSWRGTEGLVNAARRGLSAILSAPYYLDHQDLAEYHYLADPLPAGTDLTAEQQALVLGGEACMWAEHVSAETVDSRIWPRMAAVAERFWSPQDVRDVPDMYRRLARTSVRLESVGLQHEGHTARMARRLAPDDADALAELLRWLMPVSFGERSSLQRTTQLVPLTGMVDAVRPDPQARWELMVVVNGAQALDPGSTVALRATFRSWQQLPRLMGSVAARSPAVASALPASQALARAGLIGQEALDSLQTGRPAGADWTTRNLAALRELERPQGLVRIAVGDQLRKLVSRAGGTAN